MKIKKFPVQILISVFFLCSMATFGQEKNKTYQGRKIHYAPEGNSFVLKNGTRKFNRALYGSNTGFRVEAGDLPEFALYMPGMGGNFKLGFQKGDECKWITEAKIIDTRAKKHRRLRAGQIAFAIKRVRRTLHQLQFVF